MLDIEWVFPTRSLAPEFRRVLDAGILRGADLWHVATALYLAPSPQDTYFITLDQRQERVARALGLPHIVECLNQSTACGTNRCVLYRAIYREVSEVIREG